MRVAWRSSPGARPPGQAPGACARLGVSLSGSPYDRSRHERVIVSREMPRNGTTVAHLASLRYIACLPVLKALRAFWTYPAYR